MPPVLGQAVKKKVFTMHEQHTQATASPVPASDRVMRALEPLEEKAAWAISRAASAGRPILIRFNNDADGICSGLAIWRALQSLCASLGKKGEEELSLLRDYQNNGAVYSTGDAAGDALLLKGISEKKPLVVLLDFGANPESLEGLKLARSEGCEIAAIDHHPHSPEAATLIDSFASPWLVPGGSSKYTAGLLSGEVAKKIAPIDVSLLQRVSLSGDRSALQAPSPRLAAAALALDYLADTARPRNSLAKCGALLSDEEKIAETCAQAAQKLAAAAAYAKTTLKKREPGNGFAIAFIDLSRYPRDGRFPPNGKIAGAVHDELAEKEARPLVTVARGRDAITFRANAAAKDAGFNAGALIEGLKRDLPGSIEAGGGHDVAASLRAKSGVVKIVLEEVMKRLSAPMPGRARAWPESQP
jgi:RecJ-like exonuclease